MSYEQWVEDFEFYVMGLGLTEENDSARCLGLFVTFGGRRVKETWALNKGKVKAQVGGAEVSEYQHARNVVEEHDEEVIDEQVQSLQAATNEGLYVFAASENFCKSTKGKINVIIDNKVSVSLLPDTGASVNIIDRSTYEVLCQSGVYPLFESKTRIFAYGSDDPLRLRGYFNAKGCFNGESVILTIYVLNARNCGNLLSRTGCEELKVVEVCVGVKGVRERHVSGVTNPNISGPGSAIV